VKIGCTALIDSVPVAIILEDGTDQVADITNHVKTTWDAANIADYGLELPAVATGSVQFAANFPSWVPAGNWRWTIVNKAAGFGNPLVTADLASFITQHDAEYWSGVSFGTITSGSLIATVGYCDTLLRNTTRNAAGENTTYNRMMRHAALKRLFGDLVLYTPATRTRTTFTLTAGDSDFDITDGTGFDLFRGGMTFEAYLTGRRLPVDLVSFDTAREDRFGGSDTDERTGIPSMLGFVGGTSPDFCTNRKLDTNRDVVFIWKEPLTPWSMPTDDSDTSQDAVEINIPRDVCDIVVPTGGMYFLQGGIQKENSEASLRYQEYLNYRAMLAGTMGDGVKIVRMKSVDQARYDRMLQEAE
jgi:hypothetical protein